MHDRYYNLERFWEWFFGYNPFSWWNILFIVIILFFGFIIIFLLNGKKSKSKESNALESLKIRYAKGEIDEEEFSKKKSFLEENE